MSTDTCRRIQVICPEYLWTVSRRHNYYSFMSRSTCILLYLATDGRQTGDNFVADRRYKIHVDGDKWIQLVSGNVCPGVNAALVVSDFPVTCYGEFSSGSYISFLGVGRQMVAMTNS